MHSSSRISVAPQLLILMCSDDLTAVLSCLRILDLPAVGRTTRVIDSSAHLTNKPAHLRLVFTLQSSRQFVYPQRRHIAGVKYTANLPAPV